MGFQKKMIATAVMFCWIAIGGMSAQTQTANLKPAETAENPKAADTTKAADKTADKTAENAPPSVNVPPGYVVGESDVLHVNVWKEQELSQTVVVRTDGNISLPLINEVKVSGLTPLQIQDLIAEKLKNFINNPQVTVTVTDIRSKKAFITGEVLRPGSYSLNAQTSVLQLIAQAGGFTPFAKRDSIVVLRNENGKLTRMKFQYKEVIKGNKTEQNVALQPGDTVVVP
ncbi:MAG TPA: polysaccharide biosynthesis/export family protein [Candidatus Angelobacter sp.]|nr:polysaccharide biosynthesis/export family protein [Candidatus Angelobacter sp.]